MKFNLYIFLLCGFLVACGNNSEEKNNTAKPKKTEQKENKKQIQLSSAQGKALNLKVEKVSQRNMSGFVEANGTLEVPPQNEATITSIVGANVQEIKVIEGEQVKKRQTVAFLSHPNIIQLQTDYLEAYNQQNYLQQEYQRQKKLYDAGVGSGMNYQKAEAEYKAKAGLLKGLEAKLRLLNLYPKSIQQGNIQERVALKSPINGYVQKVEVKTGQFVEPQTNLFEIMNTEHIHADFLVYEKDAHKVKKGQKILFSVQSLSGKELEANIFSVSKAFEKEAKAVHVHAEIEKGKEQLIPGMYIEGRILTENIKTKALPESAIVKDGDKYVVFKAEKADKEWNFTPVQVKTGKSNNEWTAVEFLDDVPEDSKFAYNNAYFILAESQKGEGGHSH